MGKTFAYLRVSNEAKVQHKAGPHKSVSKQGCKVSSLELAKILKDLGITGTTYDRDGMAQFIAYYNGAADIKPQMLSALMDIHQL